MATGIEEVEQGSVHQVRVDAKSTMDEGIGKIGDVVVFIKNAKTRMGNTYKVKVTKVYRTFAYGEVIGKPISIIGSGSVVELV
jgi:predicted RNA-binding protein with TRAM domain